MKGTAMDNERLSSIEDAITKLARGRMTDTENVYKLIEQLADTQRVLGRLVVELIGIAGSAAPEQLQARKQVLHSLAEQLKGPDESFRQLLNQLLQAP
jgi:hypothetical protein